MRSESPLPSSRLRPVHRSRWTQIRRLAPHRPQPNHHHQYARARPARRDERRANAGSGPDFADARTGD